MDEKSGLQLCATALIQDDRKYFTRNNSVVISQL